MNVWTEDTTYFSHFLYMNVWTNLLLCLWYFRDCIFSVPPTYPSSLLRKCRLSVERNARYWIPYAAERRKIYAFKVITAIIISANNRLWFRLACPRDVERGFEIKLSSCMTFKRPERNCCMIAWFEITSRDFSKCGTSGKATCRWCCGKGGKK